MRDIKDVKKYERLIHLIRFGLAIELLSKDENGKILVTKERIANALSLFSNLKDEDLLRFEDINSVIECIESPEEIQRRRKLVEEYVNAHRT